MAIYDVFSKRGKPLPSVFQTKTIPQPLRQQVLWIWRDLLFPLGQIEIRSGQPFGNSTMKAIRDAVCREHGLPRFSTSDQAEEDLITALLQVQDTRIVVDMIERSFKHLLELPQWQATKLPPGKLQESIEELNHRFREHSVGFQFDIHAQRLIPINSTFTYEEVVRPALAILAHPDFANANKEFIEGWDDFKKSDFDDCLVKCGSCFESVMKIICDKKGWKPAGRPKTPAIVGLFSCFRPFGIS